jgi:hypothetical protein
MFYQARKGFLVQGEKTKMSGVIRFNVNRKGSKLYAIT